MNRLKQLKRQTAKHQDKLKKKNFFFLDGTVKLVSKVAIPANPNSTKSQLTSLLTTPTQNKTFLGTRRIYMTKCKCLVILFLSPNVWFSYDQTNLESSVLFSRRRNHQSSDRSY